MFKKLGEALFIVFLFWAGWVLIGSDPTQRMQRACTAVGGPGHFVASLASAANTDWGGPIQTWTDNGVYRCQLTLWNYFYADEWRKTHPGQPLPGEQGGLNGTPMTADSAPQASQAQATAPAQSSVLIPSHPAAPHPAASSGSAAKN